jgi:hypothetical protein
MQRAGETRAACETLRRSSLLPVPSHLLSLLASRRMWKTCHMWQTWKRHKKASQIWLHCTALIILVLLQMLNLAEWIPDQELNQFLLPLQWTCFFVFLLIIVLSQNGFNGTRRLHRRLPSTKTIKASCLEASCRKGFDWKVTTDPFIAYKAPQYGFVWQ